MLETYKAILGPELLPNRTIDLHWHPTEARPHPPSLLS